jgi:hypothetical protein
MPGITIRVLPECGAWKLQKLTEDADLINGRKYQEHGRNYMNKRHEH